MPLMGHQEFEVLEGGPGSTDLTVPRTRIRGGGLVFGNGQELTTTWDMAPAYVVAVVRCLGVELVGRFGSVRIPELFCQRQVWRVRAGCSGWILPLGKSPPC